MPRKTDGIEFDIHPGPNKDKDGKPLLYVRTAKGNKLTKQQFLSRCQKNHQVYADTIEPVLEAVIDELSRLMVEGYRVDTPLGSFAPKLRLLGEHTDPKTITGRDVMYDGIEFKPAKEFVKQAGRNKLGFRKSGEPVGNSQIHDPKAMAEALRKSLLRGDASIQDFMYFSHLKRDSAKKYLDSLCEGEQPILQKRFRGRQWIYYRKKGSDKV